MLPLSGHWAGMGTMEGLRSMADGIEITAETIIWYQVTEIVVVDSALPVL
jgi:hypothetical protein